MGHEADTLAGRHYSLIVGGCSFVLAAFIVIHGQLSQQGLGTGQVTVVCCMMLVAILAPVMGRVRKVALGASGMSAELEQEAARLQAALASEGDEQDEVGEEQAATPNTDEEKAATVEVLERVRVLERAGGLLDSDGYRRLARRLKRIGKFKEAETAYLQAFELDPSDPAPLNFAAVIRSRDLGDHDGAEALYRKALAVDPSYVSPLYNMACNEVRRGRGRKAISYLILAIEGDSKYRELALRESDSVFGTIKDDPAFLAVIAHPADSY
jgi:Flp pilus assembly protein TadD